MPGNYSHTTRATGTVLTANIYNSDHQNHIDNQTPTGTDDYSIDVAQMKLTTDPGEAGTESLATSTAGEIERLRFAIQDIKAYLGLTSAQWYSTPSGIISLSALPTQFASGTEILFHQSTAPTGWTKSTTNNDKALRVVSGTIGTGGATAFSSVFGASKTTGSYTLTTTDIPAHSHTVTGSPGISDPGHLHDRIQMVHTVNTTGIGGAAHTQNIDGTVSITLNSASFNATPLTSTDNIKDATYGVYLQTNAVTTGISGSIGSLGTANAGGGGSHNHMLSLDLQYVDVIIASKD